MTCFFPFRRVNTKRSSISLKCQIGGCLTILLLAFGGIGYLTELSMKTQFKYSHLYYVRALKNAGMS